MNAVPAMIGVKPDPSITETEGMYGKTVRIGDAVKHFCERWTGNATARVVGFAPDPDSRIEGLRVIVWPATSWGGHWAADRTEHAKPGHCPPIPTAAQALAEFEKLPDGWTPESVHEVAAVWRTDGTLGDVYREALKAALVEIGADWTAA